jgi:transposase
MTLRYDEQGRPAGLDWTALSANCPQEPSVWSNASLVKEKRPGTRIPNETETLIIRLHLGGMAAVAIAAAADVSAPTVSAVLNRHEIRENRGRGTRQRTPDHVTAEIIRLYVDEGLAGARIGELTGVRHATVYKILRRNGIQPRGMGTRAQAVAA